ncbi:MAG: RDD family protein [Eubacterium sp.]|nr:RDD family protein [Eubacterium sp.]
MKKTVVALRILCALLDAVVLMIPMQFVMLGVFRVPAAQAELLYKFLFAVYGALFMEYLGATPGKYLGRLCCVDADGGKVPILYAGLRELVKSMYLIPVIGWLAATVSIVMMAVRKDGRTLHDLAGNTKVVCRSAGKGGADGKQ